MSDRRKFLAAGGPDEVLAQLCGLIGSTGAKTFELGYEWPDDAPDPDPHTEVEWYVEVIEHDGEKHRQTRNAAAGDKHALVMVTVDLLTSLGANVAVLNMDQDL